MDTEKKRDMFSRNIFAENVVSRIKEMLPAEHVVSLWRTLKALNNEQQQTPLLHLLQRLPVCQSRALSIPIA